MGKRYTKFTSNYLMRSDHQRTDLGRVMERDWVTTNSLNVLRFGSGRRVWYNSGSFVFTTSNIPTYHKRHRLNTDTREWTWDDVKDADGTVNEVRPLYVTNDLRDYAYYGSCVELIRATIEEVVSDFPGRLVLSNDQLSDYCSCEDSDSDGCDDEEYSGLYQLRNQFNIDLHHKSVTLGDYDNEMRFMSQSWANYRVLEDEDEETTYVIIEDFSEDFVIGQYIDGKTYALLSEENHVKCEEISTDSDDTWYVVNEDFSQDFENGMEISRYFYKQISSDNKDYCKGLDWIKTYEISDENDIDTCPSNNECKIIKKITITTYNGDEYIIDGYYINGEILYFYEGNKIYIQPTQEYIDDYFASLTGFKAQLLRRDSSPLYTNKFITPTEYNFRWYYPEKQYTWPSDGYCVQVGTMPFTRFVEKLYDVGQSFDDMWTDNLYRSMTHEAIKNFDWSYSREFYVGDAQDNIDGGERMQKIIRVMGRVFDDVKLYIDNIKNVKNITYDKIKNCSEALLSDENFLKGIDVTTTIGSDYNLNVAISSALLSNDAYVTKDNWWKQDTDSDTVEKISTLPTWYSACKPEDIYPDVCDNEMMRRLALSVKRIMQTKGTQHGIEMILALFGLGKGVDYTIEEEAYYTEKPILYDECVDGTMEGEDDSDSNSSEEDEDNWDDGTINWKNINKHTKGELAQEVNSDKDSERLYYSDPISGVPMRAVTLGRDNTPYLVPYYDSSQLYDGDLVFQSKGGWGRMMKRGDTDSNDDYLDYQETLSYLHVAETIGAMLSINPVSVDANTIYYVTNLDDYTDYDENPPMSIEKDDDGNVINDESITMSHFFILINPNEANKFYAWKNIVVKPELDNDGKLQAIENSDLFKQFFEEDWAFSIDDLSDTDKEDQEKVMGTYSYAFKKMMYLDSIISTNLSNNPHVGYGKYDDGNTFLEYMKLPFKYTIDNGYFGNSDLGKLAEKYTFDDIGDNVVNDKIQIMNSRNYEDYEDGKTDYVFYGTEKDFYKRNNDSDSTDDLDDTTINAYYTYNDEEYNVQKRWHINTKVLTITNIMESENTLFDNYFKNVIMPYLMQVVPSTTILKIKDFSE